MHALRVCSVQAIESRIPPLFVLLLSTLLFLSPQFAAASEFTQTATYAFESRTDTDYLLHYDAETGETEQIDLEIGTPSTNPEYVGNYKANERARRNVWSYPAPHLSRGIMKLWNEGWTGKGVTIYVQDSWYSYWNGRPAHGEVMISIIKGGRVQLDGRDFYVPGIAPEATIVRSGYGVDYSKIDIWNQSFAPALNHIKTESMMNWDILFGTRDRFKASVHDILVSKAAGNTPSDNCKSFMYCNRNAVGLTGSWDPENREWERDPENTTIVAGLRDYGTPAGLLAKDYLKVNNTHWGTSGAAAVVSGAAALLKQKYPNLSARQLKILLLETAIAKGSCTGNDRTPSCTDSIWGHGMLNMRFAMTPAPKFQPVP